MKTLLVLLFLTLTNSNVYAKIPVSVTVFENKTGESHCRNNPRNWWYHDLGSAFREMLEHTLSSQPGVQILERAEIKRLYDQEHELINSQNTKKVKRGEFKQARYSLVGTVTEYEYCDQDTGANVDVGNLLGIGSVNVGGSFGQAKVVITIKVIDVETGEVLKSIQGEGTSKSTTAAVNVAYHGGFKTQNNSPLAKAAREAIEQATPDILTALNL